MSAMNLNRKFEVFFFSSNVKNSGLHLNLKVLCSAGLQF